MTKSKLQQQYQSGFMCRRRPMMRNQICSFESINIVDIIYEHSTEVLNEMISSSFLFVRKAIFLISYYGSKTTLALLTPRLRYSSKMISSVLFRILGT
jgi:hypothetical protein